MASGGAFSLLTNDGKQDDMILANRFLLTRIQQISQQRASDIRYKDPSPTLADVEKTHILFVNAHFKPFVAAAHEYQVQQYGKTGMGQHAQFSIALYGDFVHDMTAHVILDSFSAKNTGTGDKYVRYCDYPGEKLFKSIAFSVNGNPLDQYTNDVYPFYREFKVGADKITGYNRMMGQQSNIPVKMSAQGGRASGITQHSFISKGPQTPQATQGQLELWIPILLWYSMDVRLALPSVAIPYGQRFLDIDICNTNEIIQHCGASAQDDSPGTNPVNGDISIKTFELYVNNIFVLPQIHDIYVRRIGFNLIRVYRFCKDTYTNPSGNTLMATFKWPVESIYGGARPASNTDLNSSKMLDNWHIYGNATANSVLTSQMASNAVTLTGTISNNPIQAGDFDTALIYVNGGVPTLSPTFTSVAGGATVVATVAIINSTLTRNGLPPIPLINGLTTTSTFASKAAAILAMARGSAGDYFDVTPTLDTIQLIAHGIELFKTFPIKFYNSYQPYFYGEKIVTPKDEGKFAIFFNFFPGSYQPSGHINISRAREFYFYYTGSTISTTNPVNLFLIAIAINFLLISDGSAVIRYST